ncbi:hypothetical protein HAX54_007727, partial [Datura stramonium]|nr:hypothetical protein [Datura stramonium]
IEQKAEESSKKKTSKKGDEQGQAPTFVDVEVSSDEKNSPTEPGPMSKGHDPKRKRGDSLNFSDPLLLLNLMLLKTRMLHDFVYWVKRITLVL